MVLLLVDLRVHFLLRELTQLLKLVMQLINLANLVSLVLQRQSLLQEVILLQEPYLSLHLLVPANDLYFKTILQLVQTLLQLLQVQLQQLRLQETLHLLAPFHSLLSQVQARDLLQAIFLFPQHILQHSRVHLLQLVSQHRKVVAFKWQLFLR